MDRLKIKRLEDLARASRELSGEPPTTNISLEDEIIKKVYTYTFYGEVKLATLKRPTKEGYRFIVYYDPTGQTFGFKTWNEANTFARLRQTAIKSVHKLWG